MDQIIIDCPAKINLSLDILGKREDGYHEISTIMQTISLYDKVKIKKSSDFSISVEGADLPLDDNNIALKSAKIMLEKYNIQGGVEINIEKSIPISAGLAGGSSDAAGVILGINKIYNLNLSDKELMEVGALVGSDVSYLIKKGTALCTGRGEKVEILRPLTGYKVLIAKPNISVSTKWVYNNLNLKNIEKRPDTNLLLNSIENNDINSISENLINVLETVTIPKYKVIEDIKKTMESYGSIGSIMSGSGPTVFGVFKDDSINNCFNELKKIYSEVYIAEMTN